LEIWGDKRHLLVADLLLGRLTSAGLEQLTALESDWTGSKAGFVTDRISYDLDRILNPQLVLFGVKTRRPDLNAEVLCVVVVFNQKVEMLRRRSAA
jgi:hypothetical protein